MLFADLALARRLEAMEALACVDTARSVARMHPEIPTATASIAGGWAVFTGVGSPISEARGLGMDGPVTEADLETLEEFYRSRGDAVRMEVCPLADASLHQLLAQRNYRLMEFSNMLARPLDPGAWVRCHFAGVSTRRAEPEESALWAQTVAQCFAEHTEITQELMDIMSCWAHSPIAACYFGYVDGELAGGGAVAIENRVALLGGAGTSPKFRGRGLQQSLIAARLTHAANAGCDLAMCAALPGSVSQRNCERQGFHVVYSRAKFTREP